MLKTSSDLRLQALCAGPPAECEASAAAATASPAPSGLPDTVPCFEWLMPMMLREPIDIVLNILVSSWNPLFKLQSVSSYVGEATLCFC